MEKMTEGKAVPQGAVTLLWVRKGLRRTGGLKQARRTRAR